MRNLYIDRLRGIAVLMVFISHASGYVPLFFYGLPLSLRYSLSANGYSGVSIFFTVSGFLITRKLLASSDESGSFSLGQFYLHRIARIMPCLLLMIACACLAALTVPSLFGVDWHLMPARLWSIFTFRYNSYFARFGGVPRVWDPLWSLSVEEIFYLCFPAVLFLVRNRILLMAGLVALIVIGPIHRVNTFNIYGYLDNFDQLSMGVVVALMLEKFVSLEPSPATLKFLRHLGGAIITANFLYTRSLYSQAHASIMWGATFIGLGSAIYLFGAVKADVKRSYAFSWLEKFGEFSYETYLFHSFFLVSLINVFKLPSEPGHDTAHKVLGGAWMIALIFMLLGFSHVVYTYYSEPAGKWIKARAKHLSSILSGPYLLRPNQKI